MLVIRSMRRLPVYILIDTSGSMKGEPIESVKVGLSDMVATLRYNPYMLETICMSIITFNREVKQILPLTMLEQIVLPDIVVPDSGPTNMGAALKFLCDRIDIEVKKDSHERKGDWHPFLFVLTDGKPSDIQSYNKIISKVKAINFAKIVACAIGPKASVESLKLLTEHVYMLDYIDVQSIKNYFQISDDIITDPGPPTSIEDLPAPPEEVNIVI